MQLQLVYEYALHVLVWDFFGKRTHAQMLLGYAILRHSRDRNIRSTYCIIFLSAATQTVLQLKWNPDYLIRSPRFISVITGTAIATTTLHC
jgi:hypothetical protein